MTMLDSLTKEQIALLSKKRDEWLQIGLATERADRERVEQIISRVYEAGGLAPPESVLWFDSPHAAASFVKRQGVEWSRGLCYGYHDSYWLGFYDTFGELGLEKAVSPLRPLMELPPRS